MYFVIYVIKVIILYNPEVDGAFTKSNEQSSNIVVGDVANKGNFQKCNSRKKSF